MAEWQLDRVVLCLLVMRSLSTLLLFYFRVGMRYLMVIVFVCVGWFLYVVADVNYERNEVGEGYYLCRTRMRMDDARECE